jgi:hypothetical protein
MENGNEENVFEDDDDYDFYSCIDREEDDDDEEELPDLLIVLGHTALHTVSTPRVWNWEAGVELVRQYPGQAQFARYKLYPDNPGTCLDYACRIGSPEAVSFLHAVRDVCLDHFLLRIEHDYSVSADGERILNYSIPVIRMLLDIHIQTDFETKNGPKLTESSFNPLTTLCSCYSGYIKEAHRQITSEEWTPLL